MKQSTLDDYQYIGERPYSDKEILGELYREKGFSQDEIADKLDCSQSTIYKYINEFGLEKTTEDYPWRDEEVLRELYVDGGLTMTDVARTLGCSSETVKYWLRKYGIGLNNHYASEELTNESLLRELYEEKKLSQEQIADRLKCSDGTVFYWLKKHGIEAREPSGYGDNSPHRDEKTLRRLYLDEELAQTEIADRLGVAGATISRWLRELDIPTRSPAESVYVNHAHFVISSHGYRYWRDGTEGGGFFGVHRLVAIADGADPHEVFSSENCIHHKNGHKFDNRPENLDLLAVREHSALHRAIEQGHESYELVWS